MALQLHRQEGTTQADTIRHYAVPVIALAQQLCQSGTVRVAQPLCSLPHDADPFCQRWHPPVTTGGGPELAIPSELPSSSLAANLVFALQVRWLPTTHHVHQWAVQGYVTYPFGSQLPPAVAAVKWPTWPLPQTCTYTVQHVATPPALSTSRLSTSRSHTATHFTWRQQPLAAVVIQPDLPYFTAGPGGRSHSP